jgi:XRE family transcriptional regulator, regulator of sulfur utilization
MGTPSELPAIGKNIHQLRKKIDLSLDELAKMCGVSKAMLSQIEQGKVNPTIGILWKIARGLGVDFNSLLGSQDNERLFTITKADSAPTIRNQNNFYTLKVITPPHMVDELELYWVRFEPHGSMISEPHFSFTEEIVTVMEGSVEVTAGDKSTVLEKGDSARYHADVKHSLREVAGKKSEVYLTVYFKESSAREKEKDPRGAAASER